MKQHKAIGEHVCRRCSKKIRSGTVVNVKGKVNETGNYIHEYECLYCVQGSHEVKRIDMELLYLGTVE